MVQWVQVGGQIIPQRGEKEVGKLSSFLTPLDYRGILKKGSGLDRHCSYGMLYTVRYPKLRKKVFNWSEVDS